jgi:hypothetical protein
VKPLARLKRFSEKNGFIGIPHGNFQKIGKFIRRLCQYLRKTLPVKGSLKGDAVFVAVYDKLRRFQIRRRNGPMVVVNMRNKEPINITAGKLKAVPGSNIPVARIKTEAHKIRLVPFKKAIEHFDLMMLRTVGEILDADFYSPLKAVTRKFVEGPENHGIEGFLEIAIGLKDSEGQMEVKHYLAGSNLPGKIDPVFNKLDPRAAVILVGGKIVLEVFPSAFIFGRRGVIRPYFPA